MLREIKTDTEHYFEDEHGRIQGEYKQWWDTGQLWEHSYYVDSQRQGEYKEYYENGTLKFHLFYNKGWYHGEYKECWADGQILSHCFYVNDKKKSFKILPLPVTPEERMLFLLKYDLPLLPVEMKC